MNSSTDWNADSATGGEVGAARTGAPIELKRLQDVGADADGDPLGGFPHRVARKVRIARGRLHPAVTRAAGR